MSEPKTPVVKWAKNVKVRNVQTRKPKSVGVIRYTCPDCKKTVYLTIDKKTAKKILSDIKSGGNPVPKGGLVAPVIRRDKK